MIVPYRVDFRGPLKGGGEGERGGKREGEGGFLLYAHVPIGMDLPLKAFLQNLFSPLSFKEDPLLPKPTRICLHHNYNSGIESLPPFELNPIYRELC